MKKIFPFLGFLALFSCSKEPQPLELIENTNNLTSTRSNSCGPIPELCVTVLHQPTSIPFLAGFAGTGGETRFTLINGAETTFVEWIEPIRGSKMLLVSTATGSFVVTDQIDSYFNDLLEVGVIPNAAISGPRIGC